MSLLESAINIVIGFIICIVIQLLVFPKMGHNITLNSSIIMSSIFTVVSLLRSYSIRRIFNKIKGAKHENKRTSN